MHAIEWVQHGLASANLLPDFLSSLEPVRERVEGAAVSVADQSIELEAIESLATAYIRAGFDGLGWNPATGEQIDADALAERLAVVPAHRQLFGRLLETLEDAGFIARIGTSYRVMRARPRAEPDAAGVQSLVPQLRREIAVLARCGSRLADVLRGICEPLGLLFPDGESAEMAELYRDSPAFGSLNALVPSAISALVESLPTHRRLRILELGAGTGGTTAHVLPQLDAARTEYFVTDVGAFFLNHARDSFGQYPFVRYAVLDIEKPLEAQSWQGGRFDLVIAANVLHATADLTSTLRNVRQLLAPGGALVLVEGSERRLWLDITFGLTEGWWRFKDRALRPDYPLVSPGRWLTPLRDAGFSAATSAAPLGKLVMAQSIILARAGQEATAAPLAPRNWLILSDRAGTSELLATALRARGDRCDTHIVRHEGVEAHALLADTGAGSPRLDGIIRLFASEFDLDRSVSTDAVMESARRASTSVLGLLQELLARGLPQPPRLWLVTEDCVSANFSRVTGVAQAPVRGLALAIALEHPEFRCTHVDVERATSPASIAALCDELVAESAEDRVALRSGRRFVMRLAPWRYDLDGVSARFHADATYLVTGGLGPL
ncbi:MAG: methyltransferase, partial [Gammaproteobacteria bacterium]